MGLFQVSLDIKLDCRGNLGQYFSSWIYRCWYTAYSDWNQL